ncbi:hypothetical protein [Kribbella sp. VKM Ac-2566]|uniref:hypothetical protein n=1 Tax=Kribbella sp. VKM Ac-2566 TaxID=2512218 RepID=UPI0010635530|nr:hypothetical protein [Kribbella sp. VKM Ac-2566]
MGETAQLDGQWRTLSITGGSAGVAGLLLVAGSQALVQVGGGEPAFDASGDEILRFLEARHDTLYAIGTFLGLLAVLALACFVSVVAVILREAEGRPAWRSAFAFTSGIAFVVLLMSPGWELAAYRTDDGVDPQIARYAFDMGNLGFANAWVALAGFLAAAGWIMVGTPSFPSWLGWVAIVAAFGFLLGRAFWTTSVWLIPYAVFWIWVVALSIYLFRGRVPGRTG